MNRTSRKHKPALMDYTETRWRGQAFRVDSRAQELPSDGPYRDHRFSEGVAGVENRPSVYGAAQGDG